MPMPQTHSPSVNRRRGRRLGALALVAVASLAAAPAAGASDASFRRALRHYESRLTADIGYLSSFSAPSKAAAPAALSRLAKVNRDLNAVTTVANRNQASSAAGRTGRSDVLAALGHARIATSDAQRSAGAARARNRAAAVRNARAEQRQIDQAISLFETGGRLLHLF